MGKGCLWLLLKNPNTGGDLSYTIQRHARCHFKLERRGEPRRMINESQEKGSTYSIGHSHPSISRSEHMTTRTTQMNAAFYGTYMFTGTLAKIATNNQDTCYQHYDFGKLSHLQATIINLDARFGHI